METFKSILFVLMIPLLGTVALLLVAGKADGKFEESGIVRIEQPKELVYEWLSEPKHRTAWVEGLLTSTTDERRIVTGGKLREVYDDGDGRRERTVEVLQGDYGKLLVLRVAEPGRVVEVSYALSVHQSTRRTRIDVTVRGTVEGWWAKLIEPILASRIEKRVEADLERLAEKVRDAGVG